MAKRLAKQQILDAVNHNTLVGDRVCGKTMFAKMVNELCEYKDIETMFGIDLITLFQVFTKGFWFREKCSFMSPDEFERFKWKNSSLYDKERKLIFCPGLAMDEKNVIYPKACLSVTTIGDEPCYFLSMLSAAVPLKEYGITWAITKEELK